MTPEEVELLSELTILIPTYNRPLELERAIEYWRDLPVTVHILDGSDKPWFPVGNLIKDSGAIFYHHIPNKSEDGHFHHNWYERINYGLSIANTEFAAIIGGDDFFLLSGLIKALKTLVECEQVDIIKGRDIFFQKNTDSLRWWKSFLPTGASSKYLKSAELIERLKFDPRELRQAHYGISRTKNLKAVWFDVARSVFSSRFLNEWFHEQLHLAFCRVKVVDVFIHLREQPHKKNLAIWEEDRLILDRDEEHKVACQLFKETFSKIDPLLDEHTLNELALSRADWLFDLLAYKESPLIEKTPLKAHQKLILTLRKYLRNTVLSLPLSVLGLLYLIKLEIRSQIENHTPLIFDEREFFEKLLLKPREELRLRVNI